MTTTLTGAGKRIVFSHNDVANMTKAFTSANGGRQAVYKLFPNVANGVIDAKLIELGLMQKPQRPTLPDEQRKSVIGNVIELVESNVPMEHQAEAARAIMLALRERFIPKKGKPG